MGYSTAFYLNTQGIHGDPALTDAIKEKLTERDLDYLFCYSIDSEIHGQPNDSYKWYEHEKDMLTLSLSFPTVVFQLSGEGEDPGDLWEKYFHAGEMEVCPVRMCIDPPIKIMWL